MTVHDRPFQLQELPAPLQKGIQTLHPLLPLDDQFSDTSLQPPQYLYLLRDLRELNPGIPLNVRGHERLHPILASALREGVETTLKGFDAAKEGIFQFQVVINLRIGLYELNLNPDDRFLLRRLRCEIVHIPMP